MIAEGTRLAVCRIMGLVLGLTCLLLGCTTTNEPYVETRTPFPTAPSTLPELVAVLSGNNDEARIGAARTLGEMRSEAVPAVPALIENLHHRNTDVQRAAAWALGQIGPSASAAVPALIRKTLNANSSVHPRRQAVEALGYIGDASAVPALVQVLDHEDSGTSIRAAESISRIVDITLPDFGGPGYSLDENGVPEIANAARAWWQQEGQWQEWPPVPSTEE